MKITQIGHKHGAIDAYVLVRPAEFHRATRASARLLLRRSLRPAVVLTILTAIVMAVVSIAGLIVGPIGLYGDPDTALRITSETAGVLIPGFMAHDALNLALGVPILLGVLWTAHRGSLFGLLLWPGALVYVLYTYLTYLVGAPFGLLFIPYVALVVLASYTTVLVVVSVDRHTLQRQFAGRVPARSIAAVVVGFALLTLGQDGLCAVTTALAGASASPAARHVWTADLLVEVPALLMGGVLLWRGIALGYVAVPGLLFQFGITPVVLAAILALQPMLTGSSVDGGTVLGLLVFATLAFASVGLFARASRQREGK